MGDAHAPVPLSEFTGDTPSTSSHTNHTPATSSTSSTHTPNHTPLKRPPSITRTVDELSGSMLQAAKRAPHRQVSAPQISQDDTDATTGKHPVKPDKPPPIQIPRYKLFDPTTYKWKPNVDYHEQPTEYRVGKGEQGVLVCEPYKSEICQHWRFKTPDIATTSSVTIYDMFLQYLADNDFVGADMARKYLQMGYTRARRYCNYKAGLKYDKQTGVNLARGTGDSVKAVCADIFYKKWQEAEANEQYAGMKKEWKSRYG